MTFGRLKAKFGLASARSAQTSVAGQTGSAALDRDASGYTAIADDAMVSAPAAQGGAKLATPPSGSLAHIGTFWPADLESGGILT